MIEELAARQERDGEALRLIGIMLGLSASELLTAIGAFLEVSTINGLVVPSPTRERLEETIARLTKMRTDLQLAIGSLE